MKYLIDGEKEYEPEPDEHEGPTSLHDAGLAALGKLDSTVAVDGVVATQSLAEELRVFLEPFARDGRVVTKQDIDSFFERKFSEASTAKRQRLQSPI